RSGLPNLEERAEEAPARFPGRVAAVLRPRQRPGHELPVLGRPALFVQVAGCVCCRGGSSDPPFIRGGRLQPALALYAHARSLGDSSHNSRRVKFSDFGPGLLLAATGIGVGDMVSSTIAGAEYGLTLVWAL